MKTVIQKISLLIIGLVATMVVNAQTIEVSVSVAGQTTVLANGGAPFDVSSYSDFVRNFFPITITITNKSTTTALVLNKTAGKYVSLSGDGATDFTIDESGITSATIAANGSQTFTVAISSGATNGTKTVILNLSSNDPTNSGAFAGGIKYKFTNLTTTSTTKASDIGLSLYPNPSNDGVMHVSANNIEVEKIVVSNIAGQTEEFTSKEFTTTLKGLLLVRLYTNKGVVSEKVIINE